MFNLGQNQHRTFPELLGKSVQEAAAYIASQSLKPIILTPNAAVTMNYRLDRVMIMVDPAGSVVI